MTAAQPLIALVGNPNAGKSALFNALTGARQKIANYPGVTVERKAGRMALADGRPAEIIDLPGSYSLNPTSPDEAVTRKVVMGEQEGERQPDLIILVIDATNMEQHLAFALEVLALGRPVVMALNMVDLAARDGLTIDPARLSAQLDIPVVETVAVRRRGLEELNTAISERLSASDATHQLPITPGAPMRERRRLAETIAREAIVGETTSRRLSQQADAILLHPIFGPLILLALLFVIFQAVFSWADPLMGLIESGAEALSGLVTATLPEGFFRDLITEGLIAGVGSVVVFLPQILILFLFILLMEASGYMARAAFIMDRLMALVGLSGRSFIPLLSSFACAIPGIMATRSISDSRDRLTTILIAPLMTCSARLPVYTVIIGAFIPNTSIATGVGLQGLVLFGLYLFGVVGAMLVAWVLRATVTRGAAGGFLMEMPKYQVPRLRDVLLGLWQRAWIFLRRAGTIIFAVTIGLWLLLSYPQKPVGSDISQVDYSAAGRIAGVIEPVVAPIGFSRDIALALIPAMAAREVAVAALATTYAVDAEDEDEQAVELGQQLAGRWSLPTALAFLAWFVFAPQCLSTIAVTRRETNSWRWPIFMLVYLFALAWIAAGITFWTASALGL
ncbi:ferrous iron transporter B [Alterisphingorhabdus coralli]|uniref:Ferrous iron transport protein B n=1 Tax=Alterisphingorhabdus coralli TaxID=3071408 RepID=A0AA97F6B5_9SPHN|nr:ferrous iron transporter B [Parasphingorhabdus sp. SCSIO 66989]WOE75194.1 ferrous iron transporter B [Parasphingorhabdus sp. SCSIO 66989]